MCLLAVHHNEVATRFFSNIVDQRSVSSITPNKDETGTIYPNPFGDYINIIFAERQLHGRLDITDITGKEIYTFSIQESQFLFLPKR
jgi:hypothetical protein